MASHMENELRDAGGSPVTSYLFFLTCCMYKIAIGNN